MLNGIVTVILPDTTKAWRIFKHHNIKETNQDQMGPIIKSYKKVWVVNFLRLSYYSFILTLAVLICFGCQSVHEPSSISTAEGFPSDLSELRLRRAKTRVRCETKYPVNLHLSPRHLSDW